MVKDRKVAKSSWGGTRPALPASSLQVIYFQEAEGRSSSQAKKTSFYRGKNLKESNVTPTRGESEAAGQ